MVMIFQNRSREIVLFLFALIMLVANGCNADFLGIIASSDLDDRLRDKNNFTFIDRYSERSPVVGESYSFLVIADTHIKDGKTWGLERLLDVITPDIKFAVFLGDVTETGARRDIETFIDFAVQLRAAGVLTYPVIGNHDIYFGNYAVWRELIGSTNYRIDGDMFTLLVLDGANSFFGGGQLDWLADELKNTRRDVFVFSHVNIFAETPDDTRQIVDVRERARLVHTLRGRADIMFMGHLHKNLTHAAGGVIYLTIDEFKDWKTYCLVTVTNDGAGRVINYEVKELF